MTATFTAAQQKIIALAPKFPALFSVLGSTCIIAECLIFDRRKLDRVYNRLLLAMSACDVLESAFNFASSWPIPRGTPGVAFAMGTTPTCTAQGFFLQFGLAIPILNTCLAIYYLLVIRYGWSEEDIRRRAEPWFHATAFTVALGTSCASLGLDLFNSSNLWCWIAPYPTGCKDSFTYGDEGNCIRGDNAWIYRWAFYYAELWTCILLVMLFMIAVYLTVRQLEQANKKYVIAHRRIITKSAAGGGRRKPPPSKSKRVAGQALWYVGAFYMTFLFSTVNRVLQQTIGKTFFPLTVLHAVFDPAQGLLNYIVYIRPRYLTYRDKNPDAGFWTTVGLLYSKDEASKRRAARRNAVYVDDDHQDEEEARKELARWRMRLGGKKLSGIFQSIVEWRGTIFGTSSSGEEKDRVGGCGSYDGQEEGAETVEVSLEEDVAVSAGNETVDDDEKSRREEYDRRASGIFRFIPPSSLEHCDCEETISVSAYSEEASTSASIAPEETIDEEAGTTPSPPMPRSIQGGDSSNSLRRRSSSSPEVGASSKRVSFHPDVLKDMVDALSEDDAEEARSAE